MFSKAPRVEKKSFGIASFVSGTLVFAVAALFLITFATPTSAAAGNMSSISGQVMAVDAYAGTLTVKVSGTQPSLGLFTFSTNKMTSITSCAQNNTIGDIGVGQDVRVTYHEKDGKLFADAVEKQLPLTVACIYP